MNEWVDVAVRRAAKRLGITVKELNRYQEVFTQELTKAAAEDLKRQIRGEEQ